MTENARPMRVVVKVGTSSVTSPDGALDHPAVERIVGLVADARAAGHQMVLVTSGAIAAGLPHVGLTADERPRDGRTLQAIAAVGQIPLMHAYSTAFATHGIVAGQVLLVPHNFFDRSQYLHARDTLERLLELNVLPVVNENDTIADTEIRFGDNDRMAALVAHALNADLLVLLTDTPGLFTADPRLDAGASLVEEIREFDREVEGLAGGSGSNRGSGGMASKLAAAKMASWAGVRTVIAAADRPRVVADAIASTAGVGTNVHPQHRDTSARKIWLAFAVRPSGAVLVDDGARSALTHGGGSLLAAGVTDVRGRFEVGDAVEICDANGEAFARGLAAMDSNEAARNQGRSSTMRDRPFVVVHRDDMVIVAG